MLKKLLLLLVCIGTYTAVFSQTTLEGTLKDKESGEPLISASVAVYKAQLLIQGTVTDFDGKYNLNLDPGTYDVEFKLTGYASERVARVVVVGGKINTLSRNLSSTTIEIDAVVITEYRAPLVEKDNGSVRTITSESIGKLGTRNINTIASQTPGVTSIDNGDLNIRGARKDDNLVIVDGIRTTFRNVPSSEIEQLQVITGGVDAQYGDLTGGVISITTKGPSAKLSGGIEAETSQFLDPYGYNLFNANVSGPLWTKRDSIKGNRTIMGYRFSGQYLKQKDDDPSAYGDYFAKQSTIDRLSAEPISIFKGSVAPTGLFLNKDDVELLKYNRNEGNEALDLTGKIDVRPSANIDFTLSGTYARTKDQFTPTDNNTFIGGGHWALLNWVNNPFKTEDVYRVNARFRHRLGGKTSTAEDGSETKKPSLLQGAYYSLQFGYQNSKTDESDLRHGKNYFDYGYVGQFYTDYIPVFDDQSGDHAGFLGVLNNYKPGTVNPVWTNYNKLPILGEIRNISQYVAANSQIASTFDDIWSEIHTNVGSIYNRSIKRDDDQYTLQATSGFDIVPAKNNSRHNIQFGINLEQRIRRSYTVAPFRLWEYARLYQNNHIIGIDSNQVWYFDELGRPVYYTSISPKADAKFYKSIREILFPNTQADSAAHMYADVDRLTPDQLSLSMFSAAELNEQGVLNYNGYDYLGNKLARNVKFDDFFKKDSRGNISFNVAPFAPIYAAGYIQDKFSYKDIIFKVGGRVDYYDANTKVLKDKYSLYGIMGAKEFHEKIGTAKPDNIGDDFKVYATAANGNAVKAYRDGDNWYFPKGSLANSPNLIFGENNLVNPVYNISSDSVRSISGNFFSDHIDDSFEDYKPQVNFMPRIAFSFPISDDANFFAHYDVLVQRPTSNGYVSPLAYYYFNDPSRTPTANGSLKPSKTVDYEVGFQQKITNASAVKLSAYYKELRDMIQYTTISKVATIGTYNTYGNLDFGTVKGFNFSYDLRRTNNFEFFAGYTLQFADGTGSDPDTQKGLTDKGINIRNVFPFSYDERHRFTLTGDYRYGQGKQYNGPRISGIDIFSNAGINMQIITASGRPFSPGTTITRFDGAGYQGTINGARYPWNFGIDMRADKSFTLAKNAGKNGLNLNVYLRVQNLLNSKSVIGVYRGSGDAADDGYLASGRGQTELLNVRTVYGQENVNYFLDSYSWRLLNPDNYIQPRRIYLGAVLEF